MLTVPALTGSEKQVKWASDIRKEYVEGVEKQLASMDNQSHKAIVVEAMNGFFASHAEAKWWIDESQRIHGAGRSQINPIMDAIYKAFSHAMRKAASNG